MYVYIHNIYSGIYLHILYSCVYIYTHIIQYNILVYIIYVYPCICFHIYMYGKGVFKEDLQVFMEIACFVTMLISNLYK